MIIKSKRAARADPENKMARLRRGLALIRAGKLEEYIRENFTVETVEYLFDGETLEITIKNDGILARVKGSLAELDSLIFRLKLRFENATQFQRPILEIEYRPDGRLIWNLGYVRVNFDSVMVFSYDAKKLIEVEISPPCRPWQVEHRFFAELSDVFYDYRMDRKTVDPFRTAVEVAVLSQIDDDELRNEILKES